MAESGQRSTFFQSRFLVTKIDPILLNQYEGQGEASGTEAAQDN